MVLSLNIQQSEEMLLTRVKTEYKCIVLFSVQLLCVHPWVNKVQNLTPRLAFFSYHQHSLWLWHAGAEENRLAKLLLTILSFNSFRKA